MRILFIDIDGTICDSSSLNHLLPTEDRTNQARYIPWMNAMELADHPPMNLERVDALASAHHLSIFLTARSVKLSNATRAWIAKHFPHMRNCDVSFRHGNDAAIAHASKMNRMKAIMRSLSGTHATVFDDDPNMQEVQNFGHDWVSP